MSKPLNALRITDTDTGYWVDATIEEAPELHEAWARWIAAEHGSSAEAQYWTALLDSATAYFAEIGCDGNDAGTVDESPEPPDIPSSITEPVDDHSCDPLRGRRMDSADVDDDPEPDFDPENIYNLPSMRQSVEEDRARRR